VITEYVDDHDVDIVVTGTHGRTGLDRYLLGRITEKVVRPSDAPVLTVRGPRRTTDPTGDVPSPR
jgi:nucleotide-binding universal stress UspA family protein